MEFTITCPIDGPVEVSLEDIDTVVLKEPERAEITFVCPECGSVITVEAIIPAFLVSAIQALAEESDGDVPVSRIVALVSDAEAVESSLTNPVYEQRENPMDDAYVEYFRRQLESVECAEDVLAEIDAGTQ